MADGSIEIYDANDGYLRYNLNSQFLNIVGMVYTPVCEDGQPPSGEITDDRLLLGTCIAIPIWNPRSQPSNGNEYWQTVHTLPVITFEGNKMKWEYGSQYWDMRKKYSPLAVGGFEIYYGVM